MSLHLRSVSFAAADPGRLAEFWSAVLGRDPVPDGTGVLLRGDETQVGLRFAPERAPRSGENPMHLHLTSESDGDQERTVSRLLALGASHVDVGQSPDEGHVVLADPEGNEFCVIEHGNAYLAGTGFLGEVACDGSRAVGLFWSAALGWPLVWDRDEETAIQSPAGGTKVAWGGPPLLPVEQQRQHFVLAADDLATEARGLVSLGATVGDGADVADRVELRDPDGRHFMLCPSGAGG